MPQECRADLDAVMRKTGTCDSCCGCSTVVASAFSNMLWINGHVFTLFLTCICHKRQHETFWKPGHILDEYVRASRMVAPVYPFVCYSHCIPLQNQKGTASCQFPKGAEKSYHSCWVNPFSKGQGDSVQKGKMCKSRFPKPSGCRLKVDCPAQYERIYKN